MGTGTSCLRQLGGTRARCVRFGRFLNNARVTRQIMLETAGEHTARAARGRHVLAIQDTSELNFSGHAGRKQGFGSVGNGKDIGLFVHPVIVVEAVEGEPRNGGILGLADAFVINRAQSTARREGAGTSRRKRPIAQKESQRWLDGVAAAGRVLGGAAMVTVVADRESDIYEEFAQPRADHVHLLLRAAQDRLLAGGGRLFASLDGVPGAGCQTIDVSAKAGQRARQARTLVRFATVDIARPINVVGRASLPASVRLQAVRVAEVDPPAGVKPVEWFLLTTHKVESMADALRMIGWYRQRWTIEQVFRTMKLQGFNIEDSQITTPEAMAKLAVAVLIGALRVMQLVHARSGATGQRLTDAMDGADEPLVEALTVKLEGKTERLKNPHAKGALARVSWVIGRLGGWDGYEGHGYKPAGPKTMAHGLTKFDAIREGWKMTKDV